jgi:hypothetical protein
VLTWSLVVFSLFLYILFLLPYVLALLFYFSLCIFLSVVLASFMAAASRLLTETWYTG